MSATNWTYTFTDYRLPPGGGEPRGLTSGALRLNRRWTLEFKKFRQTAAGESKTGLLVCLAGLVALAVGSVGPWVTAVFVSASGTQGDGKLTLIAAGLGALFLLPGRGTAILTALLALGGLGVAIYDIVHVSQKAQDLTINGTQIAHVGWGLYVCAGGAAIAFIGALMHFGGRVRAAKPTEAAI